jgi:predicted  nucleic acid-binding Zn-ribbon protein
MTKPKKEITNKDISKQISKLDSRISSVEKNFERKFKANTELIEGLAVITKRGFDSLDQRLTTVEEGQKDIQLRLNEVAYAFEVKELFRKVNSLELKVKKLESQRK